MTHLSGPSGRRSARSRVLAIAAGILTVLAVQTAATGASGYNAPASKMHHATGLTTEQPQSTALDKNGKFHCQQPSAKTQCYGPAQIRAAYSIQPLLDNGLNGAGKTITIIDAFQNPTMASDLASFDSSFNLPAPPSFTTIAPFGLTPFNLADANQRGWSGEIALDVEWAHAVAPNASIVLALAPSDADADIVSVESYVINNGIGDVVSMSYGEAEQCMSSTLQQEQHSLFATAAQHGMSLVAAAGDEGAAQYTCDGSALTKAVSTPASDPNVTGVGGTSLSADLSTGAYQGETVWNEANYGAGGGGFSSLYSRPSFQAAATGSSRGVPDVTYNSAFNGGVIVAWGSSGSNFEFWIFYGTSAGAPQWSGILSIADQAAGRDLGNANSSLYKAGGADFHDIVSGDNSWSAVTGFTAASGWDAASGLGSPVASRLVADLSRH